MLLMKKLMMCDAQQDDNPHSIECSEMDTEYPRNKSVCYETLKYKTRIVRYNMYEYWFCPAKYYSIEFYV